MATADDAQLILKLYELRTEATMRKARQFMMGFDPLDFDEIAVLQRDMGSEKNGYYRQVITYWEMAAALVLHGALDAELFADCNGENVFLYARFTPFLEQYREAFGTPFMYKTGKIIETYPALQKRYTTTLAMLEARRKRSAASLAQQSAADA